MNKQDIEAFLLAARTQTYAKASGKVVPLLPGSVQYEFAKGEFIYRDVYCLGNGIFPGLETVLLQSKARLVDVLLWRFFQYDRRAGRQYVTKSID